MKTLPLAVFIRKVLLPNDEPDDAGLEGQMRGRADTNCHPVCACKMGVDNLAVVAVASKMRGSADLRVVDFSVMPRLIGSNTDVPMIMIAEKTADMVQGKTRPEQAAE